MILLYNIAFALFGLAYLPFFFLKLRQADNGKEVVAQRMGFFPRDWKEGFLGKRVIWIHAVSVGEVRACEKFLEKSIEACPEYHFVLTTVTPTGQKVAQKLAGKKVTVCYFPFDLTFAVRNFIKMLGPECLLLMETELWPNLLLEAKRFRVPVGILNGRLSDRSSKRYYKYRLFLRGLFESLDFVLVQTREDKNRFLRLGISEKRVHLLGNMKFDNVELDDFSEGGAAAFKKEWGFRENDQIFIAGSTHGDEERKVIEAYSQLYENYPNLKLIVAPRHIERSKSLARFFKRKGFRVRLATQSSSKEPFDVLLVNCLGVLKNLYSIADVVFMGGSFAKRGGQNPIEPAAFKRAILHGPNVFNFRLIYQTLDYEGAAILVRDADQLFFAVNRLLRDPKECSQLGTGAFEVVKKLQGATERHVQWVKDFLNSKSTAERIKHAYLD